MLRSYFNYTFELCLSFYLHTSSMVSFVHHLLSHVEVPDLRHLQILALTWSCLRLAPSKGPNSVSVLCVTPEDGKERCVPLNTGRYTKSRT
jgi:hypothetical protein